MVDDGTKPIGVHEVKGVVTGILADGTKPIGGRM